MAHRLLILISTQLLAQNIHDLIIIPNPGHTTRGTVEFRSQDDLLGAKLRAGSSMVSDFTLDLPSTLGSVGDCMKLTGSTALGFGACAATSGWTLSGTELYPVDTQTGLHVVRSVAGQSIGALDKAWSGVFSTSFQVPQANGLNAKASITSTALNGFDSSVNLKASISFNSGLFSSYNGGYEMFGVSGTDTDAVLVSKDAALSGSNWSWRMSHRSDGKQLWFYGYNGSSFFIPLKLDPTTASVCINCSGSATPTYSLDVNGLVQSTGFRAASNSGFVNAPYVEVRDPATNFHWGMQARVDVTGERSLTIRNESGGDVVKFWSMQVGAVTSAMYLYGRFEGQDILPDADATFFGGRLLGSTSQRWYQAHVANLWTSNLVPANGTTDINFTGHLIPIGTRNIGTTGARVSNLYVSNLDVTSCTGCGGTASWTDTGTQIYPTSAVAGYEVTPRPSVNQYLGSATNRWQGIYGLAHYVPHTTGAFMRAIMSASGLQLYDAAGNLKFLATASSGDVEVYGTLSLMGLTGGGNAQLCINASGDVYRGTPGC